MNAANAASMDYFPLLDRVHRHLLPRTYVEIGVRRGDSLTFALPGTRAVGIDPEPRIKHPVPRHTLIAPITSDEYFATHDLRADLGGLPLDLAFIDGMHLFEFALRDFMNIERHSTPHTVVLVHDCYPIDAATAARDRTTDLWSGDVWKLTLCLKRYRPDLRVNTIDVAPTGLGVVTALDATSTVLADHYDEIVDEFGAMPYAAIEADKAAALNRIDNDWAAVRGLLPSNAMRRANATGLVWLRGVRQSVHDSKAFARKTRTRAVRGGARKLRQLVG